MLISVPAVFSNKNDVTSSIFGVSALEPSDCLYRLWMLNCFFSSVLVLFAILLVSTLCPEKK